MAHPYLSTLDITANTNVKDYSPYFYRLPLPGGEARLWNLLNKREDVKDTLITWHEDADVPLTAAAVNTADGDLTASDGDTNLVFASGVTAASFLRVGMLLRDMADGKSEIIQLTTDNTAESWTITRGIGATSAEAHDRAATWMILGTPQYEGSGFGTPLGANRTPYTNTTSILDDQLKLTRTQMKQVMHAVPSNWIWTLERTLRHFERTMERHVVWAAATTRATSVPGTCNGIVQLKKTNGASTLYDTGFGNFTYKKFDDIMLDFAEGGYGPETDLVMIAPFVAKQAAAYIHESAFRANYASETTRGLMADTLISTQGHRVPILPIAGMGDRFMILPLEKVAVRFVEDSTMIALDIPYGEAGNDFAARRFISEFTVELHNAATAVYLAEDVDFVVPE